MKLEVGMYVRTKGGLISKIKSITRSSNLGEETIQARFICENNNIYDYDKYDTSNDIKGKPSHNIIELIEENDYVNGCKVSCISKYENCIYLEDISSAREVNMYELRIFFEEIETIVTHEQMEAMQYKVV